MKKFNTLLTYVSSKLLSCLQNAVYVLLDNVIFPDFLFQLAIIGVKGFFLRLECFIFLLQRALNEQGCNSREVVLTAARLKPTFCNLTF